MAVWHNTNDGAKWEALPLKSQDASTPLLVAGQDVAPNFYRHILSKELDVSSSIGRIAKFTIKYRATPNSPWLWVNQQFGTADGEIVLESPELERGIDAAPSGQAMSLDKFLNHLNNDLDVQRRRSESVGAALWSITGTIAPASRESRTHKAVLGVPTSVARYFSLIRIWEPWLAPRHGKEKFMLAEDGVLCSFLRQDGLHLVLLAVSGVDNVLTVFQSGGNGEVVISSKNDNPRESTFHVLAGVAHSFEIANSAVMYEARKVVRSLVNGPQSSLFLEKEGTDTLVTDDLEKDPQAQWMSDWYDGLTYCTWNALGQDLTEEKILNALDILDKNEINIANLIIDDNWQSLDDEGRDQFKRGWMRFEANETRFPDGLKKTVERIREKVPNLDHIAVWHSLLGYWGGISPSGDIANDYKTKVVKTIDSVASKTILAVDPDDANRLYDNFYSFLSLAGIDSVKTDCQFFLDLLEDPEDRARFTKAYQDAWSISSLRYFSAKSISCMSQTPQIIFHSQVPTDKPRILLRNSDDFFPEVPSSHPWHLFCNAHNSLFTQHLNIVPDWDMFQTSHPYASFHGAARCVSGGPVSITDEPGKHDINLINQMTAQTNQGKTIILRPSVVGRTLDVYHNYNDGHMLRVGCYTGWARTGSGILGLFNIDSGDVSSLIPLADFPGVRNDGDYVVRAHTNGEVSDVIRASDPNALIVVSLQPKGWEILTAYPVHDFSLHDGQNFRVAVLGLLGKMTGVAAITSSDIFVVPENKRLKFSINLKALGVLGIYISDLGQKTVDENFMVTLMGKAVPPHTVRKADQGGNTERVLEIDVLTAWREMGLSSGWNNEVSIQMFMS
ncbi:hypothetical protein FQN54_005985 [Arachnomyces sp. PD_36]|nr:hypothetical protein FQN54_005985 [Arachnomyces sp. PD_36]